MSVRPGAAGRGRRIAVLHAHAVENLLGRNHRRAFARAGPDIAHHVAARDRASGLRQFLVAARVIPMHMRIDDVTDRLVGNGSDRRQHLVAEPRIHRVHQQNAFFTHLHGDVAARAHQHVDVALHGQHVNLDVVEILRLLREANSRHSAQPRDVNRREIPVFAGHFAAVAVS